MVQKEEIVESPLALLIFAILIECTQIIAEFIHLYVYSIDGYGIWILDLLNNVLGVGSQFFVVCIFLLIGCGWTLTYHEIFEKDHYLFVGGFALALNGLIAIFTYLDNGESHKFHDFSGWPGLCLVIVRVMVYLYFILRCNETAGQVNKKHSVFFNQMRFAGTLYFLAFPALYGITFLIQPYLRHRTFIFGHYAVQTFAMVIMLKQLTSRDSSYKKLARTGPELGGLAGLN
jgi:hypothetical protein